MANEERNAWAALIAGIITYAAFGSRLWQRSADGIYSEADGLSIWAWDVIWLILGGIAIVIVTNIAFQILYAIVTRQEDPKFITDERDVMIARRGSQITLFINSAGFVVAVGLLANAQTALVAFNTLLVGLMVGATASELYRLAVYRFGF